LARSEHGVELAAADIPVVLRVAPSSIWIAQHWTPLPMNSAAKIPAPSTSENVAPKTLKWLSLLDNVQVTWDPLTDAESSTAAAPPVGVCACLSVAMLRAYPDPGPKARSATRTTAMTVIAE